MVSRLLQMVVAFVMFFVLDRVLGFSGIGVCRVLLASLGISSSSPGGALFVPESGFDALLPSAFSA